MSIPNRILGEEAILQSAVDDNYSYVFLYSRDTMILCVIMWCESKEDNDLTHTGLLRAPIHTPPAMLVTRVGCVTDRPSDHTCNYGEKHEKHTHTQQNRSYCELGMVGMVGIGEDH